MGQGPSTREPGSMMGAQPQGMRGRVAVKERYHGYLPKYINRHATLTEEKVRLVSNHWNFIAEVRKLLSLALFTEPRSICTGKTRFSRWEIGRQQERTRDGEARRMAEPRSLDRLPAGRKSAKWSGPGSRFVSEQHLALCVPRSFPSPPLFFVHQQKANTLLNSQTQGLSLDSSNAHACSEAATDQQTIGHLMPSAAATPPITACNFVSWRVEVVNHAAGSVFHDPWKYSTPNVTCVGLPSPFTRRLFGADRWFSDWCYSVCLIASCDRSG